MEKPEYEKKKLSYMGRLDPMAEGVMLVLVGGENKEREKYLNMEKEYEFEVLFGFSTDTFDLLGLVTDFSKSNLELEEDLLKKEMESFKGVRNQIYPPYSSKTVAGKPLFEYARAGELHEIKMPARAVEIFDIALLGKYEISKDELLRSILDKVNKVKGDFRQEEIIARWKEALAKTKASQFIIAKIRMHSSSGTYARSVAVELGRKLSLLALAYSIKRIAYR